MRTVRLKVGRECFISGQKLLVWRECGSGLWLKGKHLTDPMLCWSDVVCGPFSEDEVEEYVPEVPLRPLEERVKEVWP